MELQEASQLGTVDDVINLIDIFSSVMTTLLPVFGVCLTIYVGSKIYKRHKEKQKQLEQKRQVDKEIKKQQKEIVKQQKKINKQTYAGNQLFSNENDMMRRLDNTENRYYDNRFDSLALEFDENGKAK